MRKVSYLLLATLTLPICARSIPMADNMKSGFDAVKGFLKPVSNFFDQWGVTEAAKNDLKILGSEIADNTSLSSIYYGTGLDQVDSSLRAQNAEKLMNKSLQKGLGGRFLGFKEAQPLPSLAASALPFTIGKGVQVGLSLIPGGGMIAHNAGQAAGMIVRLIFKSKLAYEESNCDSLTLNAIQSLSEDVSAGFGKKYKSVLEKLSQAKIESFVMYASISILDHIDHLLKTAKDGDILTSKQLIEGMSNRYLKIDHGAPTLTTVKRKLENGLKRKRGLGAKTAGKILTNALVQHEGNFFIDKSKLDAKRAEDGKKRGRLSRHRRLDPNYPRVLDEKPDPKRYKPVTSKQIDEMVKDQKRTPVERMLKNAKKALKNKSVSRATAAPAV